MTPCLHRSDLIPVCPAIKTWEEPVDAACLHRSLSERERLLKYVFSPSDQLIGAVLKDQTGQNLLEV